MPDWLGIIIVLAITGLFFVPVLWLRWVKRREAQALVGRLEDEPLATAGPLPDGPLQAEGICAGQELLTAPISGQECIGYSLEVSVFCEDTDGGHYWDLALVDELAPFTLELGNKRVEVGGEPYSLCLTAGVTARRDVVMGEQPPALRNRILAQGRQRYASVDRLDLIPRHDQEIRMAERLLLPGHTALAIGESRSNGPVAAGAVEQKIVPRQGMPLVVVDDTRAQVEALLTNATLPPLLLERLRSLLEF